MTQEEIDKLPTILDILENIAKEEEFIRNDKLFSNQGFEDKFEIIETESGCYTLTPISSTFGFYRGQTEYFESCKPSLYRNYQNEDETDRFLEILKATEFELLLEKHPFVIKLLNEGLYYEGGYRNIFVDTNALAQHYEFRTDNLDFTNSKWVAAFFAVSEIRNSKYIPINSNGFGVFYYYDFYSTLNSNGDSNLNFRNVGLQPFSRPAEQKAFLLRLNESEDLNSYKYIRKVFFRHDELASEIIYNRMNQGIDLFPNDNIIEYVYKIKNSKKFTDKAFEEAIKISNIRDRDKILSLCKQQGYKIVNYPVVKFDKEIGRNFYKKWPKIEDELVSKIVYRNIIIPTAHDCKSRTTE